MMSGEKKKAFEVRWRLENIKPWLQTKNDSLFSPPFLANTMMNTTWKLKLSKNWKVDENCMCLTLYKDTDDHLEPITLHYELSILACDGSPIKAKSCTTKFFSKTVSQELKTTGVEILKERTEDYLPEGVLTVCCKMWMVKSTITKGGQCIIRSVFGSKSVTLEGTIEHINLMDTKTKLTVNFMSPSSEIRLISFDVKLKESNRPCELFTSKYKYCLWFERREVECKCFSMYSCIFFALDAKGEKVLSAHSGELLTLLSSNESCAFSTGWYDYEDFTGDIFKNDPLNLKIQIIYYPGIKSENIEYYDDNDMATANEAVVLKNENACKPELEHSNPSDWHEAETCYIEQNEDDKRNLPSTTLKEDLVSLFHDRLFCDTKLRTDTETLPAHKNILSARSPVFKKMFTTDMKEKAGEYIDILDINSLTLRRMLQFMYTDSTGDLDMQSAKDLYIASDKYDIVSLKQRCLIFMKKNLCPANVCEVLVLADMHQDKDLESAAQGYVMANDEEVFYSDEWKLFMKNHSDLAAQMMYLKFTTK